MLQNSTVQDARLARRMLRPLRADLIQLVIDLVRASTVAIPPEGNETPGQLVLRRFLRRSGLHSEMYETEFVTKSDSPWKHMDRNLPGAQKSYRTTHGFRRRTQPAAEWTHGHRANPR